MDVMPGDDDAEGCGASEGGSDGEWGRDEMIKSGSSSSMMVRWKKRAANASGSRSRRGQINNGERVERVTSAYTSMSSPSLITEFRAGT